MLTTAPSPASSATSSPNWLAGRNSEIPLEVADLPLPQGPDGLLDAVRTPLARAFGGEHHLRVGRGTALAARWQHRHSTRGLPLDPRSSDTVSGTDLPLETTAEILAKKLAHELLQRPPERGPELAR